MRQRFTPPRKTDCCCWIRTPYSDALVICYNNGNIDIIRDDKLVNVQDVKNKSLSGSKRVQSCRSIDGKLYLVYPFGIVIFDMDEFMVKDTWFTKRLGEAYTPTDVAMAGQRMFVSTTDGAAVDAILNVLTSSGTVTIGVSESLLPSIETITKNSTLLYKQTDMVALSMVWSSPEIQNPGIVYESARRLAWNSINVLEIFSTVTELSFVIKRTDSFEAYRVLQDLQRSKS